MTDGFTAPKRLKFLLLGLMGAIILCTPAGGLGAGPIYNAYRANQPPIMDGRLDDACWGNARAMTDFTQVLPVEGAEPSEGTEVRLVYTRDQLYIGIRCFDTAPRDILATQMQRDSRFDSDDYVSVAFDTFGRGRDGYLFAVNPVGARRDALFGQFSHSDDSWDTIWDAATHVDDQGWTAEIVIPFKSLSFDPGIEGWRWNVQRTIRRKQETLRWTATSRTKSITAMEDMGELKGMDDIRQGLGLDINPYLRGAVADGTENGKSDFDVEYGFDATYHVTPTLTAVATYNTDFAETEVDDRVVRLSRFPVFFPEKRDFFLQDSTLFNFGGLRRGTSPYYSRSIGLGVDGRPVEIVGGGRITGRMEGASLALLDVYQEAQAGIEAKNLAVARVSQQVLSESSIGGIFTYGDPRSNMDAWLGGIDFSYQNSRLPKGKVLTGNAFFMNSHTDRVGGNDTAFGVDLNYPNEPIDTSFSFQQWGDNFEPAMGFIGRKGIRSYRYSLRYILRPNTKLLRRVELSLRPYFTTDLDNRVVAENHDLPTLTFQTPAGDQLQLEMTRYSDFVENDFEIWPGVVVPSGDYDYWQFKPSLQTSSARQLSASLRLTKGDFYSGRQTNISTSIDWRPSSYATFEASYELNQVRLPQGSFNVRLASLRVDLALTPDLTWSMLSQYDNRSDNVGFNSRLRWAWRPGNDLVLVWNNAWDYNDGRFENGAGEAIMKIATTFRF